MKRMVSAGIVALGMLAGTTGVAWADEQAFLDQLPPRGYAEVLHSDAKRIEFGYQMCAMIRSGTPPEVFSASWGQPWVSAAQHGLCPDTLGGQAQP